MKASSIFSHCAEALRTIAGDCNPSRKSSFDYLKKRKYIGSKERKFILSVTFAVYRNYFLSKLLSDFIVDSFGNFGKTNPKTNFYPKEFLSTTSITFLHSIRLLDVGENLSIEFHNLPGLQTSEFSETIIEATSEYLDISTKSASAIYDAVVNRFKAMNNEIDNIINDKKTNNETTVIEQRYSLPTFVVNALVNKGLSKKKIIEIANSLTKSANVSLRVNEKAASVEDVSAELNDLGIKLIKSPLSPSGIILKQRTNILGLDLLKKGIIELQDESSQLVSYALGVNENASVLDACAGAGGKTLHLAALLENEGEILSLDISPIKLKELIKRTNKFGFKNVRTRKINRKIFQQTDGGNLRPFTNKKFDRVLLDAPCSGSGTARREPKHKYNLSKESIQQTSEYQTKLLDYYSRFVNVGGIMAYAVCSIMPDEGEALVKKFLTRNEGFVPAPLNEAFKQYEIDVPKLDDKDYALQIYPSDYDSDGFFIARLKRIK